MKKQKIRILVINNKMEIEEQSLWMVPIELFSIMIIKQISILELIFETEVSKIFMVMQASLQIELITLDNLLIPSKMYIERLGPIKEPN